MRKNLIELQMDFVNLRFGMFIHFNSATVQFNEGDTVDWEFDCENGGQPRKYLFDPADWKPGQLNCGDWAEAAKMMGASFAALTAKHHEGFALWPSDYTEHCVKNASVKTDVVAEYVKAFLEKGILPGLYFSILDLTRGICRDKCDAEDKVFIKNQLKELLTNYGEIPFIIIDGWAAPWGGPGYDLLPFDEIDSFVKNLQPNCLLMNIGETESVNHSDIVFFESAHGQKVHEEFAGPGASCNILTDQWFWRKSDSAATLKSADWALKAIENANSKNTVFILNASPNTDGVIEKNLLERYAEIGKGFRLPSPLMSVPERWLRR